MGMRERRFLSVAMGQAAGQFRAFGNEDLILIAPIDEDLVLMQVYPFSPSSPCRRMTWRTCRT